jgi:hypothetical protein
MIGTRFTSYYILKSLWLQKYRVYHLTEQVGTRGRILLAVRVFSFVTNHTQGD